MVAAGLAALSLSACTGGQLPVASLRNTPGAGASYPGAVVYQRMETEAEANAMAKNPAMIKVDACAPDTTADVLTWFDARLRDAGWSRDPGHTVVGDTGEFLPDEIAWSRGERHFQLRFLTPAYADHLAARTGKPSGCTGGYETILD